MSMLPLYILEILRKRTDEQHTLNQKDIIDRLRIDYGLEIERKAVRTNMERLVEMGYPIQFTETEREGNTIWSNFWYRSEFSDAELRLMIDSLLFSNHIPHASRQKLVKKIEGLTSEHFKSYVKHIATLPDTGESNKQIFYNIAFLDEAISKKQKVAFQYLDMDIDKKLHPKLNDEGEPKTYVVSPYQMAARDGKYYLICNYDKYNDISNYRIDRIADVKMLDEPVKPFETLDGADKGRLDLAKRVSKEYCDLLMNTGFYHFHSPITGEPSSHSAMGVERTTFWSAWTSSCFLFLADRYLRD